MLLFDAIRGLPPSVTPIALALSMSVAGYRHIEQRVSRLENVAARQELVSRYTGCMLREYLEQRLPGACEVLVAPDVIEYLRPRRDR